MAKTRGSRVDGERTRARILDEALPLFADHGFAGTSIRRVATAAEVNVATLAYHFTDKQGLYDTVITRLHEDLAEHSPKSLQGNTPAELVDDLVATAWVFCCEHRNHIRMTVRHVLDRGQLPEVVVNNWTEPLYGNLDAVLGAFQPTWSITERRLLAISTMHQLVRLPIEDRTQLASMIHLDDGNLDDAVVSFMQGQVRRALGL